MDLPGIGGITVTLGTFGGVIHGDNFGVLKPFVLPQVTPFYKHREIPIILFR